MSAIADQFLRPNHLKPIARSSLSHRVRTLFRSGDLINNPWLQNNLPKLKLPTPAQQVVNLVRTIGVRKEASGEDTPFTVSLAAEVGCYNSANLQHLVEELVERKLIVRRGTAKLPQRRGGELHTSRYDLTLDGWEMFEREKRGGIAGSYGFLALKFGDAELDAFVATHLKPAVKDALGFEIVDMRDVGRAGLIDNIMREQIRDAAFVIADLTHNNLGAYWEAGYAEGLGKPVIYICQKTMFETAKTHFDTNHSTTVLWLADDPDLLKRELVATLRRSLGLF